MHKDAFRFVAAQSQTITIPNSRVVEIGSLDVNGSIRPLFAGCAEYIGIDKLAGPGVDVVCDVREYAGTHAAERFDVCVCCEVLEHDAQPWQVIDAAKQLLKPGGTLILTAAGPNRKPHGVDGKLPQPGEHYANITLDELERWLSDWCNVVMLWAPGPADVYARAEKKGQQ
jgi:SAM-dependent methyltransferase